MRITRWIILAALLLSSGAVGAQGTLAARVYKAITAAGAAAVPPWTITSVSIGEDADKATWKVHPGTLQGAAQPTIDTFDPNDPAHEAAELDAQVKAALDHERLPSAIVWVLLKQMYPTDTDAQLRTKFGAAYARIVGAYKAQPWKP